MVAAIVFRKYNPSTNGQSKPERSASIYGAPAKTGDLAHSTKKTGKKGHAYKPEKHSGLEENVKS